MNRLTVSVLLIACTVSTLSYAANWQPLTGASVLQDFVSGATAEIELVPGVTAVGKYYADGTAEIEAWNETFERTWMVKGNDQVCYSSDESTNCFTFEQNMDDVGQYRSRNMEIIETVIFRIRDVTSENFAAETSVDSDGGFGSPDASEIAAALSDPNTTLGSMNFQFDHIEFDGDIPGAGCADDNLRIC